MLGEGLYTLNEAATLAQFPASTVRSWFQRKGQRGTVFTSDFAESADNLLSFLDLIDVKVVGELRQRGVSMARIRRFYDDVGKKLGDRHPFAHQRFYTDGADLFVGLGTDDEEAIASTTTGQTVFVDVVRPFLAEVSYSKLTRHAESWQIANAVVLDPRVNFGAPTIAGTRLRTDLLANAVVAEGKGREAILSVSRWFDVPPQAIKAAMSFEQRRAA